jgi:hypothetical protein
MSRRPTKAVSAGFADTSEVEGGETGEAPMASGGGDTAQYTDVPYEGDYDYSMGSSDAGSTSGVNTLQLEIEILSAAAIDRIAQDVARRVASKAAPAKIRSVTIASPQVIAFLRLHSAIEAEIDSLEKVTDRLESAAPPEAIQTSDQTAFGEVAVSAAETARKAVKSATSAIQMLAVSTKYSGRSKVAQQVVLDAAIAKYLSAQSLEVELPERALPSKEPRGLFARMLQLQARCKQLQDKCGDVDALSTVTGSLEDLQNLVFGTSGNSSGDLPIAQQLMLADGVAEGMAKGRAVLLSEIVFSGGSYRTRKWIFNILLGRDGLTYNGGAGVTYFLFRGDDRSTLDSDTLYFASPHGRFHEDRSLQFQSSNLTL